MKFYEYDGKIVTRLRASTGPARHVERRMNGTHVRAPALPSDGTMFSHNTTTVLPLKLPSLY